MMLIMSLWRQVDYCCKTLQPWQNLQRGPVEADDSVLLDYVSPIFVTSLIKAVRRRHYPVAISITGFILLKTITIFSTGLFVLTTTGLDRVGSVTLTTRFDGDHCMPHIANIELAGLVNMQRTQPASSRAAFKYQSIADASQPYPEGTSHSIAFQYFEMAVGKGVQSTSVEVDVFRPNITCEAADVIMLPDAPAPGGDGGAADIMHNRFQMNTGSCVVGSGTDTIWLGDESCYERCPASKLRLELARVNCSALHGGEDSNENSLGTQFTLSPDSSWDIRYATLVANFTYTDNDLIGRTPGKMQSMTAVICKTDYSLGRAMASLDRTTELRIEEDNRSAGLLNNIRAAALGEMIWNSIYAASEDASDRPEVTDFYANLLLKNLQGNRSLERLLSASDLQSAATKLWGDVAAQYIHDQCMTPSEDVVTAKVQYNEWRLHLAFLSLWSMFTGFLLVAICAIGILRTAHQSAGVQNPASIATNALIIAGSMRMNRLLRNSGHLRTSGLSYLLRGYKFQAFAGPYIHLTPPVQHILAVSDTVMVTKPDTWVPLAARRYMVAVTMGLPIVFIIGLEAMNRTSTANQGLLDVSKHEKRASAISRYISALCMLMIATCFNMLDFAITSLAPYNLLRSDHLVSASALKLDLLGQLPPVAIFQSLRRTQFGPALSNLTGFLGPFLTIISSGL
ncbi:hypothetical protein CKM354_000638400 [Cercospora kikuchii]|uniref:Uncharacterized protein n=1 Tax=Cercospora kikuchii TaxID=84275 RepID=A0A9P3CMD9_9PEZI|nr:uncharacterized protein CKM354_000638400 [Cercospora kikuchii]GIZ43145.1 hypothetical protein CKM354_000638400 [Cercospora kikuchii]